MVGSKKRRARRSKGVEGGEGREDDKEREGVRRAGHGELEGVRMRRNGNTGM